MKSRIFWAEAALASACLLVAAFPAKAAEKSVLMLLWRGETDSETVFKKHLGELGFKVNYTIVDGKQDRNGLVTTVRAMEPDFAAHRFDLVYSHGTTVTEVATATVKGRIPQVFDIVFDPVRAQFVKSMAEPGGTITGVANGTPVEQQLDAFHALQPFKRLCHIFNSRETNSALILEAVKAWAQRNGVELVLRRVAPDTDSLAVVLGEFRAGVIPVDAVYAGADSYVSTKAAEIREAIGDRYPLYAGTETFMLQGWLATYAPTLHDLGMASAEQAARVLKGESPAKVAVVLPSPRLIVSKAAAEKHHLAIPPGSIILP